MFGYVLQPNGTQTDFIKLKRNDGLDEKASNLIAEKAEAPIFDSLKPTVGHISDNITSEGTGAFVLDQNKKDRQPSINTKTGIIQNPTS